MAWTRALSSSVSSFRGDDDDDDDKNDDNDDSGGGNLPRGSGTKLNNSGVKV